MSGQYTRSKYDANLTDSSFVQSTKPGYLVLTTAQEHQQPCISKYGPRNNRQCVSSELGVKFNESVKIESKLKGIGNGLSRNIDIDDFLKNNDILANEYGQIEKVVPQNCSDFLSYNYTRFNPNEKLQEKAWNRYEYPIQDPMSRYFSGIPGFTHGNNRCGQSTRYDTRNQLEEKNKLMRKAAAISSNVQAKP